MSVLILFGLELLGLVVVYYALRGPFDRYMRGE